MASGFNGQSFAFQDNRKCLQVKCACSTGRTSAHQYQSPGPLSSRNGGQNGYLKPLVGGASMGVISEAGCPAVADPGADVVAIASGFRNTPAVPKFLISWYARPVQSADNHEKRSSVR